MPHPRDRHAIARIRKRLRFARVVTLQGARQTGKSFLARQLLPEALGAGHYITLDRKELKEFAEHNPDSFLARHRESAPLIIDEAQKAPPLFDAIKVDVDENPEKGRYVLLGSTEFSREARIKEALTGRVGRVRLYPFTLAESKGIALNPSKKHHLLNEAPRATRAELLRHLERGGFPGIFSVREDEERAELLNDWLSTTVSRDLLQFRNMAPDPEVAEQILRWLPRLEQPDLTSLARKTLLDPRTLKKHLGLLKQLFALHALPPHPFGTGKHRYFVCDVGLAGYLGADLARSLATWLLVEQLSQRECRGELLSRLSYYRGVRGGIVDLVVEHRDASLTAYKLLAREKLDLRDLEILKSFGAKCAQSGVTCRLIALGPFAESTRLEGIQLVPWEAVV